MLGWLFLKRVIAITSLKQNFWNDYKIAQFQNYTLLLQESSYIFWNLTCQIFKQVLFYWFSNFMITLKIVIISIMITALLIEPNQMTWIVNILGVSVYHICSVATLWWLYVWFERILTWDL